MPCTCCKPKDKKSNLVEHTFHIKTGNKATCLHCEKVTEVTEDMYFNSQEVNEKQFLEFLNKHSKIFEFLDSTEDFITVGDRVYTEEQYEDLRLSSEGFN
jgi:uncharacterized protein Smg (DUF494 family)